MSDSLIEVIVWVGVILSVIIVALWFIGQIRPVQQEVEVLQHDLREIITFLDRACSSIAYERLYNPLTISGELTLNQTHVCIDTGFLSRCQSTPCLTQENTIQLEDVLDLKIIREQDNISIEVAS